jgi:multidrug efflux pump subunit AcrA (membrane-fusion protein)
LTKVQLGAPARIQLDDGRTVEGTVRLVAPTIDPKTRNGLVHVALPAGSPLRAGGHAQGEITVADTPMLTLPEGVVQSRDGQPFVYVVGNDSVARQTRIETGARQRGLVEVTGGLPRGAHVVATGAGFVKDGERVNVAPAKAGGST